MAGLNIQRQVGFTLLELLITVALVAILLTLALPAMRSFVQENKLTAQSNEFRTALSIARLEAIKRSRPVSMCASNNATDCAISDWQTGWIVYVDSEPAGDTNTGVAIASEGGVIRTWQPGADFASVAPTPSDLEFVRFLPDGRLDLASVSTECDTSEAVCFQLTIDDLDGCQSGQQKNTRLINVSRAGRARVDLQDCP